MGQLRTSPPPLQGRELHAWVLQSSTELKALRAALHQTVHKHPSVADQCTDHVLEQMLLVVTELASNAIKHGLPPTEVRLSCTDEQFILDVADHDLSSVPELADTRPVDAGGRGLKLALSLSLDVGWYATDSTKHVWASFPIAGVTLPRRSLFQSSRVAAKRPYTWGGTG
ncbi:ATP-binding protein [Winogradskya consettensis]|uniref:ATP-binding protein n=1 Tax=Winogradskya consettensis TaxID=113560 RepID=UPI001BB33E3D|nr:ATP-binding protein [Actinoplanes consettensis]